MPNYSAEQERIWYMIMHERRTADDVSKILGVDRKRVENHCVFRLALYEKGLVDAGIKSAEYMSTLNSYV